jgi:nucleoside-diphosphate-sugar epimerase
VGPRVSTTTGHIARVAPAALQGKTVRVFGSPDQPHSFTDVRDMARALVRVAGEPSAWGRVWHAPTNPAKTQTEVLHDVAASVGRTIGKVKPMPHVLLSVGGAVVPLLRELRETEYQFAAPYVLDSSDIEEAFGLAPTPWDEVCRATAENALLAS